MEELENRISRILRTAQLIEDKGNTGCTIYEIMNVLGFSNRSSAFNVLSSLEATGFAYYTEKAENGSKKILYKIDPDIASRWKRKMISTILSSDDIRFLGFLLESVSSTTPLMNICGKDFLSRLSMVISPGTKRLMKTELSHSGNFFKAGEDSLQILLDLLEACDKGMKCVVTYQSRNSEKTSTYDIYPLKMLTLDGAIYAHVINNYGQVQLLALTRIKQLSKRAKAKYPIEKDDVKSILSDPFPFYHNEEPIIAKIRIEEYQGWYEIQKAWTDSVSYKQDEDGSYLFTVKTTGTYGLIKWVLSMGSSAEILEPQSLRDEMKEHVNAMYGMYN